MVQGDPTEGALVVAARKAGMTEEDLSERYTRVGEVPFSSERKMMSTALEDAEREDMIAVASKGAPDVLLARCTHERTGGKEHLLTPHAAPKFRPRSIGWPRTRCARSAWRTAAA